MEKYSIKLESAFGIGDPEQVAEDGKMSGARDGQDLRKAVNQAEKDGS
jgi:hypothetical protein